MWMIFNKSVQRGEDCETRQDETITKRQAKGCKRGGTGRYGNGWMDGWMESQNGNGNAVWNGVWDVRQLVLQAVRHVPHNVITITINCK